MDPIPAEILKNSLRAMDPTGLIVQTIWENHLVFLLVLARIGAFLVAIPLLGGQGTSPYIKAMTVLALTFAIFPVVKGGFPDALSPPSHFHIWEFVFDLLSEIILGLIIAFGVRMSFAAAELGAEVSGMQMGFGLANAFDPVSNQQVSLIRQAQVILVSLLFLAIDGHHLVLQVLLKSFELIPSTGFYLTGPLIDKIIRIGSEMFILGMKIAAPVMIALIMAQIAMGVLSRAVPQIQVFMLSFPVIIGVGLIVFGLSLNLSMSLLQRQMTGTLESDLSDLLMSIKPS